MGLKRLRSFKPLINRRSRVLILGSMPGPEALRKRQYYGFDGNHFWHILPKLFGEARPTRYAEKVKLVKRHRVALWDVLHSCTRRGALDSEIRTAKPNNILGLLKRFPGVRAVFINGRTAQAIFNQHFLSSVTRPVFYLPSTSPAHAALSRMEKLKQWKMIKEWI